MTNDLDKAVDEACEPMTPRQRLEGYLEMVEGSVAAARRIMARQPDLQAEFERDYVELREPCEHRTKGQLGYWCYVCGAIRADGKWRFPERGR